MKNLIQRTLTGIIFVAVIIVSVLGGSALFTGIFNIILIFTLYEFYGLMRKKGFSPQTVPGIVAGSVLFLTMYKVADGFSPALLLVNIFTVSIVFFIELYRKKENPLMNIMITVGGIIYVALPFSALHFIGYYPAEGVVMEYNWYLLLGFFVILWSNDTGAYVVGSLIGKNRLFPRISPKKSWEGSIGGGLFALGVGYLFYTLSGFGTMYIWAVLAVTVVIFGTLGDLVESLIKRDLGVKDSGSILPGHGGFLDRFDAVLGAAPMVVVAIYLLSYFM